MFGGIRGDRLLLQAHRRIAGAYVQEVSLRSLDALGATGQ
jgi:hypothetical protein